MKTLKHFLVLITLAFTLPAIAKNPSKSVSDTKTWKKSFVVNSDALFNLSSRESDVTITTWDQNRIDVTVTLTVEAFEQEEIDKLFEAFTPYMEGSSSEVTVTNPTCVQQVISTPNRMRLKIDNKIIKVKNYHFRFDVKMPASNHINLKNRFGSVAFGNHQGKVDMELYECDFSGGNINSTETMASLKFSDGELGTSRNMNLTCYESDVNLKNVEILKLDAKFSDLNFLSAQDAEITAYECKLDLGTTHTVVAKQNFGKLKIAEAQTLSLTSYELNFEIGSVGTFSLPTSKFSKIKCGTAGTVKFGSAYENQMTFGSLKSLEMEAKFSSIDIGKIEDFLIVNGYELQLNVGDVSRNFTKIDFKGKFSNANFGLSGNPGYKLTSSLSYGNLEFPNENLENLSVNKSSNTVSVSGKTKNYSGSSTISISGYETDVELNYR